MSYKIKNTPKIMEKLLNNLIPDLLIHLNKNILE